MSEVEDGEEKGKRATCLLDMRQPVALRNSQQLGFLYKIKLVNIPAWMGEGLRTTAGYRVLLWGSPWELPMLQWDEHSSSTHWTQ